MADSIESLLALASKMEAAAISHMTAVRTYLGNGDMVAAKTETDAYYAQVNRLFEAVDEISPTDTAGPSPSVQGGTT